MKKIIIGVVILLILALITVIVIKERKKKKGSEDSEEIKNKLKEGIESAKVLGTVNNKKDLPVNKISKVSERTPTIGTRLLVSPSMAVAYNKPEAKRSNMSRGIRKDIFAGTFLSLEENNFTKLLDERENVIFMLSKDLYYMYK